jgi:hypothetical protein
MPHLNWEVFQFYRMRGGSAADEAVTNLVLSAADSVRSFWGLLAVPGFHVPPLRGCGSVMA